MTSTHNASNPSKDNIMKRLEKVANIGKDRNFSPIINTKIKKLPAKDTNVTGSKINTDSAMNNFLCMIN